MVGILRDVFDLSEVHLDDPLLSLSDPSAASVVVAHIRRTLRVNIPVADYLEAHTVAGLAATVAARSLAARSATRPPPLVSGARGDQTQLSFDQQRLWMENQLLPGPIYNVHGRRRIVGHLDVPTLEASIRTIVARHETLRSRFPTTDDGPVQVVDDPSPDWTLRIEDLTTQAAGNDLGSGVEAAALRVLDEELTTSFDLQTGPLIRYVLIKLSPTEHILGITMHHIVSDAWSVGVLIQELTALYRAGADPDGAGLPALDVQYRDYATWQRAWLTGDALDRQIDHWREHLAGVPSGLALPTVLRRTNALRAEAGQVWEEFTAEETDALRAMCRDHGVTSFMVLYSVFASVLSRWSGQTDIVIGVPVAGRNSGTDRLIGFFVNLLPVRIDLADNPSFEDLLARVRDVAIGGFAHAEAPMDELVRNLEVMRDPRRTPFFEVVLNVVGSPEPESIDGLSIEAIDTPSLFSRYDLTLTAQESSGVLRFKLDFPADRCDPEAGRAVLGQMRMLLRAAAADPTQRLLEHPLEPNVPGVGSNGAARRPEEPSGAVSMKVASGDIVVGTLGYSNRDRIAVLTSRPGLKRSATTSASAVDATVVVPDELLGDDFDGVVAWLKDEAITVVYLDGPMLRALWTRHRAPELPNLRAVVFDNPGDLLPHDIIAARELAPGCLCAAIHHPSADGQPLAFYVAPPSLEAKDSPLRVPLGTPPPGAGLVLRHMSGVEAAIGELAEIWDHEEPTGAFGRRWLDGSVEYALESGTASIDDPMQTVAALRDIPGVRDAIVLSRPADSGDTVLMAYVAGQNLDQDPIAIHGMLKGCLPDYLVPRVIHVLDALPRTPQGDYDLGSLPEGGEEPSDIYLAPRTPIERELTAILEELLDIEQVGIYDSFFELGGFSLLAAKLTTRVKDVFGVQFEVRHVFESPTVEELAASVLASQAQQADLADLESLLAEVEAETDLSD